MFNTKMKQTYNKLIRDKILEKLDSKNIQYSSYIAGDIEYKEKLDNKLQEEVDEFLKDQNIEELADILEVIHTQTKKL
ncbi:MAG: nucleoside triphosphate pyrophosphohydrolase [Patescibacteria group bacterium]|nr:nucleoside triphosphate pyrophosphohydrolase [Patescibacteria group bacterium]